MTINGTDELRNCNLQYDRINTDKPGFTYDQRVYVTCMEYASCMKMSENLRHNSLLKQKNSHTVVTKSLYRH